MTARGNEEQVEKAKKVIQNAVIGLIIVILAYAITLFIGRLLGVGGDNGGIGDNGGNPPSQNFDGSGALGGIIKDHYPMRDQTDVARNTKIIITFRKPIKVDSFVQNTNQSKDNEGKEIFGDCVNIGATMDWKKDCDSLIMDKDHISIQRADNGQDISGATVLASYQDGKAYTVVIRPYEYLGSSTENVGYKVRLGNQILLDDALNNNPPIFSSQVAGNSYYEWQFTCGTQLDLDPPYVKNVYPEDKSLQSKNTVIQIDFSEAMDPTGIQGKFNENGGVYVLEGNSIYLKSGNSSVPLGNFNLTNGYRTLEFTSTQECGVNACGAKIYCLPVCDKPGSGCTEDTYELLAKAAKTFTNKSFEAIPFSGVMDVASNALDGNQDKKIDVVSSTGAIFPDQKKPDNYFWAFKIRNVIDNTSPAIRQVTPGLDAQFVPATSTLSIQFSKRMRIDPMYSIGIEQQPSQGIPLCRVPRVTFDAKTGTTLTELEHCPFLKDQRNYYFPTIGSEVEDVNYNCFYPGKGPGGKDEISKHLLQSSVCDSSGKNCCAVTTSTAKNAFCCNGLVNTKQSTMEECMRHMREASL
jgi:hypothetical protein